MSDFLFEIFSEEIPASMQANAAANLTKIASEVLSKNNLILKDSQLKSFAGPNRLVLYIYNLAETQKLPAISKIGPKISSDKKAIDGFLRSIGLSSESELSKVDNNGHICYLYLQKESEIKVVEIIKNSLPQIIQKITTSWPKLMRFDVAPQKQEKWIRPVRNIACMFGDELIDVEFFGLKSNKFTYAHNFNKESALEITNAAHYQEILEDNFVILDQEQRKQKLISQIHKIKFDLGLDLVDLEEKSSLFEEVAGLCRWPIALFASIDERFLEMPDEVLILTLKYNQKYFCLKDREGNLSNKFIFVINGGVDESNYPKIIKDNEKLVRARLYDVEFFINEDLKHSLISRFEQLKKISFHEKLGSIYEKSLRLSDLAKFLSVFVPRCDLSLVDRAADLCKVDLTTKAVFELPELQGKIGSFYALKQKENHKIAAAIYEHYLPIGANSDLPKTSLGVALSIADKIDSIVGFFLANEKPTSSKDPFALRRAALGIIRIGFYHNIAFPIRILIEKSLNSYPTKLLKNLLGEKEESFFKNKKALVEEVVKFFVERLKVYLKENDSLRPDIVNAVIEEYLSDLEAHKYCDILYLAKKVKFLDLFIKDSSNQNLIQLYKRSSNILAIEEKKDGKTYAGSPSRLSLKTKHELVLYRRIKQISKDFSKMIIKGDFDGAFKLLHVLEAPLAQFFDNVVVNEKEKNLRENRLLLLSKIRALFSQVADLSKIEIS